MDDLAVSLIGQVEEQEDPTMCLQFYTEVNASYVRLLGTWCATASLHWTTTLLSKSERRVMRKVTLAKSRNQSPDLVEILKFRHQEEPAADGEPNAVPS